MSADREVPQSFTLPPGTRVEPGQRPERYFNIDRPPTETVRRSIVEVTVGTGRSPTRGADYGVPLERVNLPTVRQAKELRALHDELQAAGHPPEEVWVRVAVVGTATPHRPAEGEYRFTVTVGADELAAVRRASGR